MEVQTIADTEENFAAQGNSFAVELPAQGPVMEVKPDHERFLRVEADARALNPGGAGGKSPEELQQLPRAGAKRDEGGGSPNLDRTPTVPAKVKPMRVKWKLEAQSPKP